MFIRTPINKFDTNYTFNYNKWNVLQQLVDKLDTDIVCVQEVNKWYSNMNYIPQLYGYVNETTDDIPMYDPMLKNMMFMKYKHYETIEVLTFPKHIYNDYNPLIHVKQNHHWSIWISVTIKHGIQPFKYIVNNFYQSPNRSFNPYKDVINLQCELAYIKSNNSSNYNIMVGDYNIKHFSYNNDKLPSIGARERESMVCMDEILFA